MIFEETLWRHLCRGTADIERPWRRNADPL